MFYGDIMVENSFWSRVYTLIKKNRIKQIDAAQACHISLRTFQNWKYRGLYPTVIDGYILARLLGVTVEYLVTGREGKQKKQIEKARSLLNKADQVLREIRV